MDLGLNGKVAIVGGASTGLGRACADALAQEGCDLVICSRTDANIKKAAEEINASSGVGVLAYAGDLDKNETIIGLVQAAIEHFGHVDILVNNSGGPSYRNADKTTEEDWEIAIQRSFLYFTRMCREAIPHMKEQGGGRIINILSTTVYTPIPHLALSGATRMGVVSYAKSLADDVGQYGILVNNVCPGAILTDRLLLNLKEEAERSGISLDEMKKKRAARNPVRRLGEPDELANLVTFLVSDKATYITGATIRVDGGSSRSVL